MPRCKGCNTSLPNIKTYSAALPFYESRPDGPQRPLAQEPLYMAEKNLARLLRDAALPTAKARDPMCAECLTTVLQAIGITEEEGKSEVTTTENATRYYAHELELMGSESGADSDSGDEFGEGPDEAEEIAECLRLEMQIAENESRLALMEEEDQDFSFLKQRGAALIELIQFVSKEASSSAKNQQLRLRSEAARLTQIEGCLGVAFSFSQRRVDSDNRQLSMGMVNDLVLGSMIALPVESAEINAALGLVALWFCSMGVRTCTDFRPYSILPLGSRASISLSTPTVGAPGGPAPITEQILPLYFSSTEGYDAVNLAMQALLRCLEFLGRRVKEIGYMRLLYGGRVVCTDYLKGRCKKMLCKEVHPPLEVEVDGKKRQVCCAELLGVRTTAHEGCRCDKFHPKINPIVVERREYSKEQREQKAGYTQGMPHSIELGEEEGEQYLIGGKPIKRPCAQSDQWSKAMVHFLQNCDYLQRCMIWS